MHFLITNSVPLNGGDEALLRATIEGLQWRWPGSYVSVLCHDPELCRRQLPDINFDADLETAFWPKPSKPGLPGKVRDACLWRYAQWRGEKYLAIGVDKMMSSACSQSILARYITADVVLSSPGGFLHDHYPINNRLDGLEVALRLGKPVILLAQSVGPFWKPESKRRVPEVFNRLAAICVRDGVSVKHLLDCGVDTTKIHQTADMAFLWHRLAPELFQPKPGPTRKIALCFRVWPLNDAASAAATLEKAERLCRELLEEPERELVFLSTCQGIPGYIDDSELALQLVAKLPAALRPRCTVDRERRPLRALIAAFGACDAYIGMRMHGCILAMLAGTPALGLGYESKTAEIYKQLDLMEYQIPFDADAAEWSRAAGQFLTNVDKIRGLLPEALDRLACRAEKNLEVVAQWLPRASQTAQH